MSRAYSVGRLFPNMISSQDGTEERRDRPPAALRAGRSRGADAAGALSSFSGAWRARPGAGIRVAPHFYTSDAELERAVSMIDDILRDGAWKPFEVERSVVT